MNTTQVGILSGVAGFALGGATVWFAVSRPRIQSVRDELSDKVFGEVERIREEYKKKEQEAQLVIDSLRVDGEEPRIAPAKVKEIIQEHHTKGVTQLGQVISKLGYAGVKFSDVDYELVNRKDPEEVLSHPSDDDFPEAGDSVEDYEFESEKFPEGDDSENVSEHITEDDVEEYLRGDKPALVGVHVVTEAEFNENEHGYDYSHLTYFQHDQIFCDETDIAIENEEMVVGPATSIIQHNDTVFIFNHNLQLRIEIERTHVPYQDHIYGRRNPSDPRYQLDPKDD